MSEPDEPADPIDLEQLKKESPVLAFDSELWVYEEIEGFHVMVKKSDFGEEDSDEPHIP